MKSHIFREHFNLSWIKPFKLWKISFEIFFFFYCKGTRHFRFAVFCWMPAVNLAYSSYWVDRNFRHYITFCLLHLAAKMLTMCGLNFVRKSISIGLFILRPVYAEMRSFEPEDILSLRTICNCILPSSRNKCNQTKKIWYVSQTFFSMTEKRLSLSSQIHLTKTSRLRIRGHVYFLIPQTMLTS